MRHNDSKKQLASFRIVGLRFVKDGAAEKFEDVVRKLLAAKHEVPCVEQRSSELVASAHEAQHPRSRGCAFGRPI